MSNGAPGWLARPLVSQAKLQLCTAVIQAKPELAERLADAPEPFWRHVREAILAYVATGARL